jgi:hypothetical protein
LDAHRGQDTMPCTQHLAPRLRAQHHHERTVRRLFHVDGTERLRQPQPDAVGVQEGASAANRFPENARSYSPTTMASKVRAVRSSSSAAACGRRDQVYDRRSWRRSG